ncbi:hypothetical protein SARC_04883 [Sphaeroforma arctica JP610]|uniref:HMG box domain-containing protein n=1 Tax=Sphaeroforma arctica JP610 TaxID=667725 RepID=A0A0L0G1X5_9EUKA|nr:hypothetical protein SARC_04883 [Sphaeroforma arctica JP610]KNC82836.1 hypothetical protein SARC_04883 [Sphaeroforma arctica JP610]|eukprot:XP_014156738.1 hypothetical protein SARC_04883 [Sphaeroforma arctica JP610]
MSFVRTLANRLTPAAVVPRSTLSRSSTIQPQVVALSALSFRLTPFHSSMRPLTAQEISKPKKPGTAYTLFVVERRPNYILENPDVKNTDVFKGLGAEWKMLSDEQKRAYAERIPGLNAQFEDDMKYYVQNRTAEQAAKDDAPKVKRGTSKKAKKDPNMPKRALSAYLFFSNDMRPTLPTDLKITEKAVKLGQMWKLTDEHQRQKYVELASKDKARYDQAMAQYRASLQAPASETDGSESD